MEIEDVYITPSFHSGVTKFSGPLRPGERRRIYVNRYAMPGKRKRSSTITYSGRKRRRLIRSVIRRPLAPARTGGFYGLNQGAHGDELKTIDVSLATLTFDSTGAITLLNGVAQGTDFTNRVGRKFNMKSMYLRFLVTNGSTQANNVVCRYLVVFDRQANAATPAITDILATVNTFAVNNLSNRDRFIIYIDKTFNLGATGANDNQRAFRKHYKRCNLEVTNGGTGATIGSIATGALYLITISDAATGTTTPTISGGTSRIRFKDP